MADINQDVYSLSGDWLLTTSDACNQACTRSWNLVTKRGWVCYTLQLPDVAPQFAKRIAQWLAA